MSPSTPKAKSGDWTSSDGLVRLLQGDCVARMAELPDESIDCVVTSPPYWGQRSYADWQGGDPDCEHKGRSLRGSLGATTLEGGKPDDGEGRQRDIGACLKCGATRSAWGLEADWREWMQRMVTWGAEVKRVLKPMGTLWINAGDCYASTLRSGRHDSPGVVAKQDAPRVKTAVKWQAGGGHNFSWSLPGGFRPKDLMLLPSRLAIAFHDELGFWVRNDVIWAKSNHMPSSVKDRLANSYEHLFLMTKSGTPQVWYNERTGLMLDKRPASDVEGQDWEWREHEPCEGAGCDSPRCQDGQVRHSFWHGEDYYFALDRVRRPHQQVSIERAQRGDWCGKEGWAEAFDGNPPMGLQHQSRRRPHGSWHGGGQQLPGDGDGSFGRGRGNYGLREPDAGHPSNGANPGDCHIDVPTPAEYAEWYRTRDVLEGPTASSKLKHFAVYPEYLVEFALKAGAAGQVCVTCGKPRMAITETTSKGFADRTFRSTYTAEGMAQHGTGPTTLAHNLEHEVVGYTSCPCAVPAGSQGDGYAPAVVLDPFLGSGTTAAVAARMGLRCIGIDVSGEYLEMARERVERAILERDHGKDAAREIERGQLTMEMTTHQASSPMEKGERAT